MLKRTSFTVSAFSAPLIFAIMFLWVMPSHGIASSHDFFAGKLIRILIGFPPGGGHDIEGRIIARHLGKHLPGKPSIIVQNMPGAGGRIMSAYLYRRAKRDGLTFGLVGRGVTLVDVLEKDAPYDLTRMPAIWGVKGVGVDLVRGDLLNVKTFKDLLKVDPPSIVVAGRTWKGNSCISGRLALDLLEIKGYKAVCAYPGTSPIKAAMEREEVTFFVAGAHHLLGAGAFVEMYEKGQAVPVWQTGWIDSKGKVMHVPGVRGDPPTFRDVYKEVHGRYPSGVKWDAYRAVSIGLAMQIRVYVLPPGIHENRLAVLRQAMAKLTADPAFASDWKRIMGDELAPLAMSGKRAEQLKNDFVKVAPWHEFLRDYVKK